METECEAVVNITVEFSYNFNLCSLIVHVNVKLQERQRHNYWDAISGNLCCRISVFSSIIFSFPNCHHWGWLVSSAVVFLGRCLFEILQTKICSRTTGSCFCSDTTERPSETGLFLNSRNGCLRILSQLISVLYRLQINTFIFVFSFFQYYNTVSFLISSESLTYWKSLSSCSSLKSDIRIMWHPRPCHLGNCWWSTFARFPSDTSQQTRPLSSNFGTCV